MALFRHVFMAAALAGSIAAAASASAQSQSTPSSSTVHPAASTPAKPADSLVRTARKEWDGISNMTSRQWNNMKVRWANEKVKWNGCNASVRGQKLSTTERWTAVGKCMMK